MNLLDQMAHYREHPEDRPTMAQIREARAIIRDHGRDVSVQSPEDGWLDELDDAEGGLSRSLDTDAQLRRLSI